MGIDGMDRSWRLSAQGQKTTRAWNQYVVKGSAELIIKLAWETALAKGYEDQCPCAFFGLLQRSSPTVEGDTCSIFKVMTQ